jgi:hypothetical protein
MVVVMPFPGDNTRPKLIDRFIFLVIIRFFILLVFSFGMAFIVESTYAYRPKTCRAKKTDC